MFGKPCFQTFPNFLTQKQGFLTQKQEIISECFFAKFSQVQKNGYFQKISELQKMNFSETRENNKFRNFRLTQGLRYSYQLGFKPLNCN